MKSELEGKKIIWVEDDNFLGGLVSKRLAKEGAEIIYAITGEEALKKIKENKPDLILLDIMLPSINGFEILKAVKNNEEYKNVPVVLFSNLNKKEDIDKGMKLGAKEFLVKSNVSLDQVVEKLKEVFYNN